jgi:hypothetical protein
MSPRRPHRRARRRSSTRSVVLIVAAAIVVLLVIGGLTQVSSQSSGYHGASNQTLATLGSVVADESNGTAGQVRTLVAALPSQSRQVLQADLDNAVTETANESDAASEAAGVTSSQATAARFATVFAQRAQSMDELRAAIDGFIGLQPAPPTGSPAAATASVTATNPSLTATQASNRITAAGALLARSDALYRSLRRSLAAAPGHGRLPSSAWLTDPQDWSAGTVAANVDLMATSPTLQATHNLVLRTIRLSPSALPTPQGTAAGVVVITPVTEFGVSVVVANEGTVNEPKAVVHVSMQNQKTSVTTTRTESMPIALGATVAMPEADFTVSPGASYLLNISIELPSGQASTLGTATQETVQIAPST